MIDSIARLKAAWIEAGRQFSQLRAGAPISPCPSGLTFVLEKILGLNKPGYDDRRGVRKPGTFKQAGYFEPIQERGR
jgi:hypothetical protein